MKTYISVFVLFLLAASCTINDMSPDQYQDNPWSFVDSSDLPPLWVYDSFGFSENSYGIEKFTKQPEYAVGHTGSITGFSTLAQYFPESDFTYVLLVNSSSYDDEAYRVNIYDACMDLMF